MIIVMSISVCLRSYLSNGGGGIIKCHEQASPKTLRLCGRVRAGYERRNFSPRRLPRKKPRASFQGFSSTTRPNTPPGSTWRKLRSACLIGNACGDGYQPKRNLAETAVYGHTRGTNRMRRYNRPLQKVLPAAISDFWLRLPQASQNGSRRTTSTPSSHFARFRRLAQKSEISPRKDFLKKSILSANFFLHERI